MIGDGGMGNTGDYWSGRRVWITGASSGIGRALVEVLGEAGARLAISARREQLLEEIADEVPGVELVLPLDVSNRSAHESARSELESAWGALDTAVFNAGISELNDPGEFDADSIQRVHEVNYFGTVYGIEASLDLLQEGNKPQLAAVSSASAYAGLPTAGAYGSSKAAQKYLMESLQFDLSPLGVEASVVCPGFVRTPLIEGNDFPMPFMIEPEEAGQRIADGLRKRHKEIHFPKRFTYFVKLASLLPGWLWRPILRQFQ